jgi:hypothetical protein
MYQESIERGRVLARVSGMNYEIRLWCGRCGKWLRIYKYSELYVPEDALCPKCRKFDRVMWMENIKL